MNGTDLDIHKAMKLLGSRGLTLVALTVYLLVMSRPIWAVSCSLVLTEPAAESVTFGFQGDLNRRATLRPSSVRVFQAFSRKFHPTQQALELHLEVLHLTLQKLNKVDQSLKDPIRQRLHNGKERNEVFKELLNYIEALNKYLIRVKNEIDLTSTDISPVLKLIESTENTLSLTLLRRAQKFGLQSPFQQTRQLVRETDLNIGDFNRVAIEIKNSGIRRPPLRIVESSHTTGVTDAAVNELVQILKETLYSKSPESHIRESQMALSRFVEQVQSNGGFNLSNQAKAKLIWYLDWIKETAELFQETTSPWKTHTKEQIDISHQIQNDVNQLKEFLP